MYRLCSLLTNQHVLLHPMKAQDLSLYTLYRKQLYKDGVLKAIMKPASQKRHRQLQQNLLQSAEKNSTVECDESNELEEHVVAGSIQTVKTHKI